MKTIVLIVYCAAIDKEFEFRVPKLMKVDDFKTLCIKIISEQCGIEKLPDCTNLTLLSVRREEVLSSEKTIYQSGLSDNDKVILF